MFFFVKRRFTEIFYHLQTSPNPKILTVYYVALWLWCFCHIVLSSMYRLFIKKIKIINIFIGFYRTSSLSCICILNYQTNQKNIWKFSEIHYNGFWKTDKLKFLRYSVHLSNTKKSSFDITKRRMRTENENIETRYLVFVSNFCHTLFHVSEM